MISLAVLDVAGTTVDVKDVVPRAFIDAFAAHGFAVSEDAVRSVRGVSKRVAIGNLLDSMAAERPEVGLAEALLNEFRSNLKEAYQAEPITALPGAVDAIRILRERRVAVWLSTGFDREIADLVTRQAGLVDVIDGLATDDDVERGRPAPDLIRFAMSRSGINDSQQVVAAGDTAADLEAASAARVGCAVGVLSGAHDRERLAACPHDLIISDISRLPSELVRMGLISAGSA